MSLATAYSFNYISLLFVHFLSALTTPARFLFFNSEVFPCQDLCTCCSVCLKLLPKLFLWGGFTSPLLSQILPQGCFPGPRSSSLSEILISRVLILPPCDILTYTLCVSVAVRLASTFPHSPSGTPWALTMYTSKVETVLISILQLKWGIEQSCIEVLIWYTLEPGNHSGLRAPLLTAVL